MKKINHNFVFFNKNDKLIAVDTLQQSYYSVDRKCFERIQEWIFNDKITFDPNLDSDLLSAKFLLEEDALLEVDTWKGDDLSRLFFSSTRNLEESLPLLSKDEVLKAYFDASDSIGDLPEQHKPNSPQTTHLPSPQTAKLEDVSLFKSLKNRKTIRDFSANETVTLQDLSTLLFASFGYIHGKEWDEFDKAGFEQMGYRKSSPSAGGLQSCDAYIAVLNMNGLENGIYYYDPENHSLMKTNHSFNNTDLCYAVCDQFWVEGISVGIFITTNLSRIWPKYPSARSLAITYAESGHFSQTVQLCATALTYQTWVTGIFRDDFVGKKLALPSHIFPAFFIGIGKGSGSSIPKDFL